DRGELPSAGLRHGDFLPVARAGLGKLARALDRVHRRKEADMTESPHIAVLRELNHHYVRSVDQADVKWFDQHLAPDFMNTNPDGKLIDRAAFLAQIGRGSPVKDIREHDVK